MPSSGCQLERSFLQAWYLGGVPWINFPTILKYMSEWTSHKCKIYSLILPYKENETSYWKQALNHEHGFISRLCHFTTSHNAHSCQVLDTERWGRKKNHKAFSSSFLIFHWEAIEIWAGFQACRSYLQWCELLLPLLLAGLWGSLSLRSHGCSPWARSNLKLFPRHSWQGAGHCQDL